MPRVYPWAGGTRGFHATVPSAGAGENQVCIYAINVNPPRNNPQIGCRTIMIPADPPFGNVDTVTVNGLTATVTGWALDAQSPGTSIGVHIYVTNGVSLNAWPFLADDARTDVNSVFGLSGRHGFSRSVTLFPGANQVCTYGIGVTPGNNAVISCRGVTGRSPASLATTAAGPTVTAALTTSVSTARPPTAVTTTPAPANPSATTTGTPPATTARSTTLPTTTLPTTTLPTTTQTTIPLPTTAAVNAATEASDSGVVTVP